MTLPTIQFEGRLKAIGATSTKDGNWTKVEFQVHPSDDVSAMLSAGINSRWQVVVVQLGDDDQPVVKPKGGPLAKQAGILCGDGRFQGWIFQQPWRIGADYDLSATEAAALALRQRCDVASRADLDHNPEAAKKFLALKTAFEEAHGMMAERH